MTAGDTVYWKEPEDIESEKIDVFWTGCVSASYSIFKWRRKSCHFGFAEGW